MQAEKVRSMSFSVSPNVYDRIHSFCAERGCTSSWLINKAVNDFLDECAEDKADYEAAALAWAEFEKSGSKTFTSDEIRKELGL